jgi:hypothetical protein
MIDRRRISGKASKCLATPALNFVKRPLKCGGFQSDFFRVELDQFNGASMQPTLQNYPGNPLSIPLKAADSGLPVRALSGV